MAMLMLSMLTNAMFYTMTPGRVSNGIVDIGLLSFDPIDVSKKVQSHLIFKHTQYLYCECWKIEINRAPQCFRLELA